MPVLGATHLLDGLDPACSRLDKHMEVAPGITNAGFATFLSTLPVGSGVAGGVGEDTPRKTLAYRSRKLSLLSQARSNP